MTRMTAARNALLAGQHHVDDAKPVAKRLLGVLKDGPGNVGEAIAASAQLWHCQWRPLASA